MKGPACLNSGHAHCPGQKCVFRDLVSVAVLFIQTDVKPDKGELVARRWRCVWRRAAREQGGMGESGAQPGTGSRPVWCEWAAGILSLFPLLTSSGPAAPDCQGLGFLVLWSTLGFWCLQDVSACHAWEDRPRSRRAGFTEFLPVPLAPAFYPAGWWSAWCPSWEGSECHCPIYIYSVCLCRLLGQVFNASIYIFLNNSYIKMWVTSHRWYPLSVYSSVVFSRVTELGGHHHNQF